jgi:hypothetical protein
MSLYLGNNLISGVAYPVEPSRNIGQIIQSTLPLTDAGLHLLDGSLINGSGIYSDFVDYIASIYDASANYFCSESDWQTAVTTYGVCGKFVYDSVNNTVRLPKITGIIEGTSGVANLGDLTEAGLPNITQSNLNLFTYSINDGFIKNTAQSTFPVAGGGGYSGQGITSFTVDASRSNSIYGNSNTVQPQSVKILYYIVIATTTKTSIEVDVDEIATDLNGKLDRDCLNYSNTGYSVMAGASMPSTLKTQITAGASGSTYTAPADGWFHFTIQTTNSNGSYFGLFNTSNGMRDGKWTILNGANIASYIPVRKGDIIGISYSNGTPTSDCSFIYAQGSESEAR